MVRMFDRDVGTGLVQYFIKVIPTVYRDQYGGTLYTNQYTYTEKFRPLTTNGQIQQVC